MDYKLSDYVKRLRSNKNQLFRDLKPRDRIVKIIETYILPEISYLGYSFVKTKMQLERNVGSFKQIVWFRTTRKNYKDEVVEFAIHLKVENEEYSRIRKTYDYSPDYYYHNDNSNLAFIAETVDNLSEWENQRDEYWYSLHLNDNIEVVNEIIKNIVSTTSTYLDENSDFEKSLAFRVNKFHRLDYMALLYIPDILILSKKLNRINIQKMILEKYNTWTQTEEAKKDIEDGVEIYKTIEKIKNLL